MDEVFSEETKIEEDSKEEGLKLKREVKGTETVR